jgi:hypothetical protein
MVEQLGIIDSGHADYTAATHAREFYVTVQIPECVAILLGIGK